MRKQEIEEINISDLSLWTENPRDPVDTDLTDFDVISRAVNDDNTKWMLNDLIKEMGSHYDFSELPTVVRVNGEMVVFDGNRRISVLKYIQNRELYSKLEGGIFFDDEPKELKQLTKIPCNVCDKETALTNIERKHSSNGSWNALERDYFLLNHRGFAPSLFIKFEEQTGLISSNPQMTKGFVKTEVLTEKNLNDIGFSVDKNKNVISNYDKVFEQELLHTIVEVVNKKKISTRGENRGQLKKTIIANHPELAAKLQRFNPAKATHQVNLCNTNKTTTPTPRKTQRTKSTATLFGRTLKLKTGRVNDLYCTIDSIYKKGDSDNSTLMIVGMSLRLLLEVAARQIMTELAGSDSIYKDFIKLACRDIDAPKAQINSLALSEHWLNKTNRFEGILGKMAHGNIVVSNDDILSCSIMVGEIIEFYFGKDIS
jgi:hypothetical protein